MEVLSTSGDRQDDLPPFILMRYARPANSAIHHGGNIAGYYTICGKWPTRICLGNGLELKQPNPDHLVKEHDFRYTHDAIGLWPLVSVYGYWGLVVPRPTGTDSLCFG